MRFQPEYFLLVFIFHHMAADAGMALKIVSEMLGRYDGLINGRSSEWQSMTYVFSTSKKKASKPGKTSLETFGTPSTPRSEVSKGKARSTTRDREGA